MYILDVIPISKGIGTEYLSYWSGKEVPSGSIVSVPLRKKEVLALVISSKSAKDLKQELKKASFKTKKITDVKTTSLLASHFVDAVANASEYFACQPGALLNTLIPKAILENADKIKSPKDRPVASTPSQKLVIQTDDEERFAHYKSIIREEFAKKKSVFFCVPTISDVHFTKQKLEKGIDQYTHVLHSSLKKAELIEKWNDIIAEDHPVLIIATGSYLSIPRVDIKTYIIEHESSRSYKIQSRPFADIRVFAEYLSKENQSKLILGDAMLRTETLWREKQQELMDLAPVKMRSVSTASQTIVDMKQENPETGESKPFELISDELEELIKENVESDEHMFIFASRRGLSPSIICGDCGTTVTCSYCKAPTVLHSGTDNFFFCHRCGEKRDAKELCENCGSWKLTKLGVGIGAVEEKIHEKFKDVTTFVLDKDSASTNKKAQKIIDQFYDTPGSILLGTEMALSYLTTQVGNTAVASIDSLFSIPDFRINEKIFHILLKIRSMTQRNFLLQTRNANQKVLGLALQGNLIDFFRQEIKEREQFGYPPFSTLIKISRSGKKDAVSKDMKKIQDMFGEDVVVFPAFVPFERNKYTMHGLLKVPREQWIDRDILQKLNSLPQSFAIKVDPETLL